MELSIYKNRKISIFLGFLEFSNIYFLIKLLIGLFKTIKMNSCIEIPFLWKLLPFLQILLITSIFVTGVLYFFNNITAYYIYFGQIILRFMFCMPSFGLLLKFNILIKNDIIYKILLYFCFIMELIRLICNIIIIVKSKKQIKEYFLIESSSIKKWNHTLGFTRRSDLKKKEYFRKQVKLAFWNEIEL